MATIDELTLGQVKQLHALLTPSAPTTIYSDIVGKYVIVRSRNEGVNAGYVKIADATGIVLTEARRLWGHAPKNIDSGGAWYESCALHGVSQERTRMSEPVPEKGIVENYSFTVCTKEGEASIRGFSDG